MSKIKYLPLAKVLEEFVDYLTQEEIDKLNSILKDNEKELDKLFLDNVMFGECALYIDSENKIKAISPLSEEYEILMKKLKQY